MWKVITLGLMLSGLLGCASALAASPVEPVALSAQLTGDASRTILSLDLNHPFAYKVFALDNPYRVVIDMPAVEFRLPKAAGLQGLGVVGNYRYGQVGPGHSRLVINTTGPVLVESAGILSKDGESSAIFKIALAATDAATFLAHLPRRAVKARKPAPVAATAEIQLPSEIAPRRGIPLVVLDPGHGGPDSGAVGPDGGEEKNTVLAISQKVRDLLMDTGRYKVSMTRETDVFITLSGRVDHAEKRRADLMVSIHADSTATGARRWQPISGATIYTRSETASDEESRIIAMRENMSDQFAGEALPSDEGHALSNIGLDLARTETKALEQILSEQGVAKLRAFAPMTLQPARSARFYVLKSPEVPAMLVETGYMNNKGDSIRLQTSAGQAKIAAGIAAAIEAYFVERDKGIATVMGLSLPAPVQ